MQLVLQLIFWACVGLMFHSYVLYPWVIGIMTRGQKLDYSTYLIDEEQPMVYILFAVYNGESVLQKKLESMIQTSYPMDRIRVLIGSDDSTDNTNSIAEAYSKIDSRVTLQIFSRRGKANVLNELVKQVRGIENMANCLIVFTDVHAMFDSETIPELVRYFKDNKVGIVGASYKNTNPLIAGISQQEKAYIQRENDIKYHESVSFGAMMGVYGACYAIRLVDVPIFPTNILMEDFYITQWQLNMGKHSILNPQAKFYLNNPNSIDIEYKRKRRISAGNFQNLFHFPSLLIPKGDGRAFCYWSHKVIRWVGPFLIILSFISLLLLQIQSYGLYFWLAILGEITIAVSVLDIFLQKWNVNIRPIRFANYFIQMNIALLDGFVWFCKGIKSSVWQPTRRNC